jgi:hypothetical protein
MFFLYYRWFFASKKKATRSIDQVADQSCSKLLTAEHVLFYSSSFPRNTSSRQNVGIKHSANGDGDFTHAFNSPRDHVADHHWAYVLWGSGKYKIAWLQFD